MHGFRVTRSRLQLWSVTFDNPPGNLVDPEMILDLVDRLEHDRDVAVVVFQSADADHFLGPYDMTRVADTPTAPGPTGLHPWLDLTVRLSRLPVVSIAVIRRASRGVGQEFALACDLRFASLERAAIDQPEVRARVVPGGGAIPRLPALIGRGRDQVALDHGDAEAALGQRARAVLPRGAGAEDDHVIVTAQAHRYLRRLVMRSRSRSARTSAAAR